MRLVVIGVNHKTAPVALRERLAFVGDDVNIALEQLEAFTDGSVIVSTCNRTEIYALVPQITASQTSASNALGSDATASSHTFSASINAHIMQIKTWLADFKQLPLTEVDAYLYVHRDTHALIGYEWQRVLTL
jgi:glutamyl-tRNA reductase